MKKVGFISLGCPKNLVDSEVMMGLLQQNGYVLTPQADEAEVLVVNTCSFIESARRESIDTILEMAELKKSGKAQRLIVAGCMVERHRAEIQAEIPEVDALVGLNELESILGVCADAPAAPAALLPVLPADFFDVRPTAPYLYDHLTPRLLATPKYSAYIKIAEGCDLPCTFCIIPTFRGKFRSRRFESVIAEAERLAANGVREITLIGQTTTSYGEDLGLKDGLSQLLERLAAIDGLTWIRTLYCYPNRVTPRLLETIAAHPRLCKYIDMPLQHASAAVLKRMKRGGSADIFLKLLERIRATIPGVSLRTTFILGFPGETEADFEELCAFVREAKFDWLGSFPYSDEDRSQSFQLDAKVPAAVIRRRQRALMALQRPISRLRQRSLLGRRLPILIEGPAAESDLLWQGRLASQAPDIDGKVLLTEFPEDVAPEVGSFGTVEITGAQDYDLLGRLVEV